jgi:hypothetical protein
MEHKSGAMESSSGAQGIQKKNKSLEVRILLQISDM